MEGWLGLAELHSVDGEADVEVCGDAQGLLLPVEGKVSSIVAVYVCVVAESWRSVENEDNGFQLNEEDEIGDNECCGGSKPPLELNVGALSTASDEESLKMLS